MAKRINDTQVRKQQILEAASALFLENGYAGGSIDDIAAACGIVRGTVLRYFHSKKELYDQILFAVKIRPERFWNSIVVTKVFRYWTP